MNAKSPIFLTLLFTLGLIVLIFKSGLEIVQQRASVEHSWGDVVKLLNRRIELVNDLFITNQRFLSVGTDKLISIGQNLKNITEIQSTLPDPGLLDQIVNAEQTLLTIKADLMGLTASNPKLLADGGFKNIQDQGDRTENRLIVAKGRFIIEVRNLEQISSSFFGFIPSKILGISPPPIFRSSMPLGPQSPNFVNFSK
jgi:LemA protein